MAPSGFDWVSAAFDLAIVAAHKLFVTSPWEAQVRVFARTTGSRGSVNTLRTSSCGVCALNGQQGAKLALALALFMVPVALVAATQNVFWPR